MSNPFFLRRSTMSRHPNGATVDIYGLRESNSGRSCEAHDICGSVVGIETVLRLRRVQIDRFWAFLADPFWTVFSPKLVCLCFLRA